MLKKQLFIISLLFGVISSAMAADPVKLYGQLQVNGNQLCSEQGEPVVSLPRLWVLNLVSIMIYSWLFIL